jgi:protein TonB
MPDPGAAASASADPLPRESAGEVGQDAPAASNGSGAGAGGSAQASPLAGNAAPEYPFLARKKGQEGLVLVLAEISAKGGVEGVRVSKSSGHSSLDEAAMEAVRRWRFQPALKNGHPVPSTLEQPIRFRLQE